MYWSKGNLVALPLGKWHSLEQVPQEWLETHQSFPTTMECGPAQSCAGLVQTPTSMVSSSF